MTGVGVVVLLVFGTALVEGLARGAAIGGALAWAASAGAVVAGLAGLAVALAWVVRAALPAEARAGWTWGAAAGVAMFVAVEVGLGRALLGFRDPTLVALVAAIGGVGIAWACAAIVTPLAARVAARIERLVVAPRVRRVALAAALVVVLGGVAALVMHRGGRAPSTVAAGAIELAQAISDVDGDGDGVVVAPRDCAPLSSRIDARRCGR